MAEKVYIWGTGKAAGNVFKNGLGRNLTGFIETNKTADEFMGKQVFTIDEIEPDFEGIIVANTHGNEIYLYAKAKGCDLNKFIFMLPCSYTEGACDLDWARSLLGDNNFNLYCSVYGLYEYSFFAKDKQKYSELNQRPSFCIDENTLWPIIKDRYETAGMVDNYFLQDLWAAKIICTKVKPGTHFDIGSRLDGFIAHLLSTGIKVKMIDIRPFPAEIEGLSTIVADATELSGVEDESIESLSALCSLEHFGLGRYGDPIDPEACFKCFYHIQNKLKIGGHLYLSVPVGKERVEFNAHRIFYANTIIENFSTLSLMEFSCASQGKIEYHVNIHKYDNDLHNGEWRYGLFHFVKA